MDDIIIIPVEKRTVFSNSGKADLCEIPDGLFEACECVEGPIRLLNGVEGNSGGFGLAHIEAHEQRFKMIKGLGYSNVRSYLADVLNHISCAGMQHDGRLGLLCELHGYFHNVICQWDDVHKVWSVTTAVPTRTGRVKYKKLWNKGT